MAAVLIALIASVTSAEAPAVVDPLDPLEARKATCTDWMMSGYPTGLDENWCTAQFGLPSAFLVKCARAQHLGFSNMTEREACRIMFLRAAEQTENGFVLN